MNLIPSGAYGFRINGTDKVTGVRGLMQPTEFGKKILSYIANTQFKEMREIAEKIILVKGNETAPYDMSDKYSDYLSKESIEDSTNPFNIKTPREYMLEDIAAGYLPPDTELPERGEGSLFDPENIKENLKNIFPPRGGFAWRDLLELASGDLSVYHKGVEHMVDSSEILKNGIHTKWAYIINLDDFVLEVYQGNPNLPRQGRYADMEMRVRSWTGPDRLAKGVSLSAKIPLIDITEDKIGKIADELELKGKRK